MRQPKWNKKSDKREENPMTKNIEGERNLKLYDSSCIIPQHIPLVPNDDAFHSEIPIFTFCNLADVFKNFSKRNSTTNEYIRTRCTTYTFLNSIFTYSCQWFFLSIHIIPKVRHLWNEKYVYQVCFYMSDFYTYHLPHVETLSNHPRRCDVPKSNKQRRAQERRNISGYPTC